jgi:hypothetical protein
MLYCLFEMTQTTNTLSAAIAIYPMIVIVLESPESQRVDALSDVHDADAKMLIHADVISIQHQLHQIRFRTPIMLPILARGWDPRRAGDIHIAIQQMIHIL